MDHYFKDVEGWAAFTDLYAKVVASAKGGDQFVEVGSWLGKSASFMGVEIINSGKDIKLVCVDPWLDGGPDLRETSYFTDRREPLFETFTRNTARVAHLITPMRMSSVTAASKFADSSVDFIMLDGDHSYEAVQADIAAWTPKMRPGSIMSGDDYLWPGVKQAVEEAFAGQAKVNTVIKSEKPNYRNSVSYWWVQL